MLFLFCDYKMSFILLLQKNKVCRTEKIIEVLDRIGVRFCLEAAPLIIYDIANRNVFNKYIYETSMSYRKFKVIKEVQGLRFKVQGFPPP